MKRKKRKHTFIPARRAYRKRANPTDWVNL